MPELPEVEAARRAVHKVAAGRRIVEAYVADDPIVFEGVAPARFRRALVGRRVKAVRRHGKHLWLELDRRPCRRAVRCAWSPTAVGADPTGRRASPSSTCASRVAGSWRWPTAGGWAA